LIAGSMWAQPSRPHRTLSKSRFDDLPRSFFSIALISWGSDDPTCIPCLPKLVSMLPSAATRPVTGREASKALSSAQKTSLSIPFVEIVCAVIFSFLLTIRFCYLFLDPPGVGQNKKLLHTLHYPHPKRPPGTGTDPKSGELDPVTPYAPRFSLEEEYRYEDHDSTPFCAQKQSPRREQLQLARALCKRGPTIFFSRRESACFPNVLGSLY